ncbi:MAG: S-layer homology domain-containing protein, partial [Bacillota bacterium]|nr:S-layer homology domain-containing protein [Bacillota bacterium]
GNFVLGNSGEMFMCLRPFSEDVSCGFFVKNEIELNPKNGFIDRSGNIVYSENTALNGIWSFNQGLALACDEVEKGKYMFGFIDRTGKYAIAPQFDDVLIVNDKQVFNEGFAVVSQNKKWGSIDKTGKFVINPVWDYMNIFKDGLAWVEKDEKWGCVDTKGNLVINLIYDDFTEFYNGIALVQKDGKFYWIDKNGYNLGEMKEDVERISSNNEDGIIKTLKNNLIGAIKVVSSNNSLVNTATPEPSSTAFPSPTPTPYPIATSTIQINQPTTQASSIPLAPAPSLPPPSLPPILKPTATSTATPTATPTPEVSLSKDTTPTPIVNEPENNKPAVGKFKDINSHWAKDQIIELVAKKIINGYIDDTFKPDNKVTRAELAVMIVKALGIKVSKGATKFKDDKEIPVWAKDYIKAAVEAGIISGYSDNTFNANKSCTRQEIVAMIMRALKLKNSTEDLKFKDAADIPKWARGYVAKAIELGIVKGYGDETFKPLKDVTRAEAAVIISNALKKR